MIIIIIIKLNINHLQNCRMNQEEDLDFEYLQIDNENHKQRFQTFQQVDQKDEINIDIEKQLQLTRNNASTQQAIN